MHYDIIFRYYDIRVIDQTRLLESFTIFNFYSETCGAGGLTVPAAVGAWLSPSRPELWDKDAQLQTSLVPAY
jgi:hypothetical protein